MKGTYAPFDIEDGFNRIIKKQILIHQNVIVYEIEIKKSPVNIEMLIKNKLN